MKRRADRKPFWSGGSSHTWSPVSPMYRAENTDEDSVNVTIWHPVHKYMDIYDQCNFWAMILPLTCIVISDLHSVSCVTVARKDLISWCKQRDFFSRRVGARFTSISKSFNQHSGTIYLRWKSYLIVRISSDTVRENYGQVWLQFAMTACVLPLWLLAMFRCCDMHVDQKRPHLTADRSSMCCWNCFDILKLVIIYQQAFIVQAD